MKGKIWIVIFAAAMTSASSVSGTERGDNLLGQGRVPCSQYAAYMQQAKGDIPDSEGFLSWALGYLSAKGTRVHGNYQFFWMEAHMRQYCENHPDALFVDAVVSLSKALGRPFEE